MMYLHEVKDRISGIEENKLWNIVYRNRSLLNTNELNFVGACNDSVVGEKLKGFINSRVPNKKGFKTYIHIWDVNNESDLKGEIWKGKDYNVSVYPMKKNIWLVRIQKV